MISSFPVGQLFRFFDINPGFFIKLNFSIIEFFS